MDASVIVGLDRGSAVPLHRQLYEGLRAEILSGRLPAGSRLPSFRSLVRELGISRNTVTGALSQLSAEGYLEARVVSGTYVARSMPDELLRAGKHRKRPDGRTPTAGPSGRGPEKGTGERLLSRRGSPLATTLVGAVRGTGPPAPFAASAPAVPGVGIFPHRTWGRIAGSTASPKPGIPASFSATPPSRSGPSAAGSGAWPRPYARPTIELKLRRRLGCLEGHQRQQHQEHEADEQA